MERAEDFMVDASIIVVTYNHAAYISLCFRSILMQNTSRRLRIVWHDDASTDETVELGEKELRNCNHEIVRIHRKKNRVSRKMPILLDIIEHCDGEYVFTLDGDDCWALDNKVDLQIDALNSFPEINLCFTPAIMASGVELEPIGLQSAYGDKRAIINFDEVIRGDGGFMPTASLCFRRTALETAPHWLSGYIPCGDYPMQVIGSYPVGALYLPEVTSVYRLNIEGSWSELITKKFELRLSFEVEFLQLLHSMNRSFPGNREAFLSVAVNHFTLLLSTSVANNNFLGLEKALNILKDI